MFTRNIFQEQRGDQNLYSPPYFPELILYWFLGYPSMLISRKRCKKLTCIFFNLVCNCIITEKIKIWSTLLLFMKSILHCVISKTTSNSKISFWLSYWVMSCFPCPVSKITVTLCHTKKNFRSLSKISVSLCHAKKYFMSIS